MPDLARMIAQQGSDLRMRQAIVTSVPTGGTCTIRFGDLASTTSADDIAGVRYLASAGIANGDTVWVLQTGGALLIIGRAGVSRHSVKAFVAAPAGLTLGPGWQKIALDTAIWNESSAFNTTTNVYTCPEDGIYEVSSTLEFQLNNNPQRALCSIRKNLLEDLSTIYSAGWNIRGGAGGDVQNMAGAGKMSCNAGDTISLYYWQNGPNNTVVSGNATLPLTTLTVERIGPKPS